MNLVFRVTASRRLILVDEAVQKMVSFRQSSVRNAEAGGILLGRHLVDTDDFVVDDVTTPQNSDRRSRYAFFRSKRHSVIANERWAAEANTVAYLGLWHTHPEADPTPSGTDRNDWAQALSADTFHGNHLFFPIVGIERIRIWTMTRCGAFHELELEEN